VYYMPYPCKKLSAWSVVNKVNPHERLHTLGDAGYHHTLTLDDDIDEIYQEEELPPSFVIDHGAGLDNLVGHTDDVGDAHCEAKMETNKEKSSVA
jgi:hypothetical protein